MATASERAKAYRQRCKQFGVAPSRGKSVSGKSGRSGKSGFQSQFSRRQFIAIDGEGENFGDEETFTTGTISDGKTYKAQNHKYTLLAASTGDELYDGGRRLGAGASFDFLLDLAQRNKRAIFVIFSGSYDVNHLLMHDIPRAELLRISRGEIVDVEIEHADRFETYRIEYRARKSLSIKAGLEFIRRRDGSITSRYKRSIRIWDVFGFFQENFVNVMRKWLGEMHPDYEFIKRMKNLRGDFANVSDLEIQEYNRAELRCLVQLMEKVADAIAGLGLVCTRWDGAGAVAGAIFKKQGIKEYKNVTHSDFSYAVRCAYSGGRIECCKIGVSNSQVFHYDINSAYPSVMRSLPCLACGKWTLINDDTTKTDFCVFHLKWNFPDDLPFYPLFFRNPDRSIVFPAQGQGWYWTPEKDAAFEYAYKMGGNVEIIEAWNYKTDCGHVPFSWIPDYYDKRQQWIQSPDEAWQDGGEKIIKLGLNSLYGKTAQQLGGTPDKAPVYFQMEWAGFITSGTRAALLMAALQKPYEVISFATDGLFTLAPIDIYTPKKKELGAWEFQMHDGMIMVMPGVYWIRDGDKYKHFSRGFDKDQMEKPERILEAWEKGMTAVPMITRRLIGLGTACNSDIFWQMRGRFVEGERILQLDLGHSQKRQIVNVKKSKPHLKMVDTLPRYNFLDCMSAPYPIKWLGDDADADYEKEKEEDKEIVDSFNI